MKQKHKDRVISAIADMVFKDAFDEFEIIKTADEWTYQCKHCGKRFSFPVLEPSSELKSKMLNKTFPEMIEHAMAERRR